MPEPRYQLCEERVQVVRLMFLPPQYLSKEEDQLAARRYVRFWTQNTSEYDRDVVRLSPADKVAGRKEMARVLSAWLLDVGLFLHGFILFKICKAIEKKAGKVGAPAEREQEIWLTTSRCMAVVKTTKE